MTEPSGGRRDTPRGLRHRVRTLRSLLRSSRGDTSWAPLWELTRRERPLLMVLGVLAIVVGFTETTLLVLLANLAVSLAAGDTAVAVEIGPLKGTDLPVGAVLSAAALLTLLRLGLRVTANVMSAQLTTRVFEELRNEMVVTYLGASWEAQHTARTGHLQDVLSGFLSRSVGALTALTRTIASVGAFVILAGAAFFLDLRFALAVVIAIAILFALLRPFTRLVRLFQRSAAKSGLTWVNYLTQITGQAREIGVYGVAGPVSQRAAAINARVRRDGFRAQAVGALVPDTYQTAATLSVISGLAIVYTLGDSDFASMSAVILLFLRASSYATQLLSQYQNLQSSVPFIEMLRDAEAKLRNSTPQRGQRTLDSINRVECRDVSFAYDAGQQALDQVSFSVERGEMIGIVGPSGAGKSTLVQLLLRLRDPASGSYLVNGTPSSEYSEQSWSSHVALVPQEPILFSATISENISFFRPGITDAMVAEAARRAHLLEDLDSMPRGLATWVGDDGRLISGGQRQRVAIARALAGDPDLIVLDEPTSALDLQSEAAIQSALAEVRGSLTLFVVAHRLSTLTDCDRIMVFENGHLTDFDEPGRLAGRNEFYNRALSLATTPGDPTPAS